MRLTTSHVTDVGGSVSEVQFDGAPMINGNATDCESANCKSLPFSNTELPFCVSGPAVSVYRDAFIHGVCNRTSASSLFIFSNRRVNELGSEGVWCA